MVHALRSRRVVTPAGERDAVVVIEGERIVAVNDTATWTNDVRVEDLGDLALLPGLVDSHTHINEPGRTEWEGFATGTRAAAAGGFTTIVDMPLNCLPETTDIDALEQKREAARGQCMVDYALWGGAVDGNQEALEPLARAGVAGYKCFLIYPGCDGFTEIDHVNLEQAIPHIARTGLPLLVHSELAAPIDAAVQQLNASGADWRKYETYLASRPDEAELSAIRMLLELCRAHRFRLHIVHLSTARALPMLAAAKREGLPVTVETCPHYLHCAAEDIADGATLFKCAPPIRSAINREDLWAALRDGVIDLVATDHSPCPPHMKRLEATQMGEEPGRFDEAWGGIASLSTALPVMWSECVKRGVGLAHLARWMSFAPAQLAGLSAHIGSIESGKHANLAALDTEAEFIVTPERLHYRHAISPYMNETLRGEIRATWLRGEKVYSRNGEAVLFAHTPRGREYERSSANDTLTRWNAMDTRVAEETILPCNGSHVWAASMVQQRPFNSAEALFAAADDVWWTMSASEWQQAFDSHPRIGEKQARSATSKSLAWSEGEQAAANPDTQTQTELAEANRAYEQKFDRIFIVCATGKSSAEMLAILRRRMQNDPATELQEAAEQQRQITQLRLRKWLGMEAQK